MSSVAFCTFCHEPHLPVLHKPGVLRRILETHQYPFTEVIVVHQRCRGIDVLPLDVPAKIYETEDYYPQIFSEYGIKQPDQVMSDLTHGPTSGHFWENHVMNHLIAGKVATAEYILFSDCDCKMIGNEPGTWIDIGITLLEEQPTKILLVSPSDGAGPRYDQTMSQQIFLIRRDRFLNLDWGREWNGKFDAPGGPFQEYYGLAEGRIGRHLTNHDVYRYVLANNWRYWHYKPWTGEEE